MTDAEKAKKYGGDDSLKYDYSGPTKPKPKSLVGDILVGADVDAPDEATKAAAMRTFAQCCTVRRLGDRIVGTCRVMTADGPVSFHAQLPLRPIAKAMERKVARSRAATGWGVPQIKTAIAQAAKNQGSKQVVAKLMKVAARVNPAVLSAQANVSWRGFRGVTQPFIGKAPIVGPRAERIVAEGAKLAPAMRAVPPASVNMLDRAARGDRTAARQIAALSAKAKAGDPNAAKLVAGVRVTQKVRKARAVMAANTEAIARGSRKPTTLDRPLPPIAVTQARANGRHRITVEVGGGLFEEGMAAMGRLT